MIVFSLHLVGDGAAHPISDGTGPNAAKFVQTILPSDNSAAARLGGSEVSSTVGAPIPAGAAQMLPPIAELMDFYDLTAVYYYLGSGDTMDLLCGG